MSGTSESELKQLVRSLHLNNIGFLGTFDCRFPGFLDKNKTSSAIVNTGTRESGGLHWIAFAWNPKTMKVFMFDPLGWSSKELEKYYGYSYQALLKRSAVQSIDRCVTLERNQEAVQCTCAGSCGLFCVLFLYCFSVYPTAPFEVPLFQSLQGSVSRFTPVKPLALHNNQQILYDFLKSKSVYFSKNLTHFVNSTKTGLIKTHS